MTNEAAERLRHNFEMHGIEDWTPGAWEQLDAALAEERRHVIEQIRERIGPLPIVSWQNLAYQELIEAMTRCLHALDDLSND